MDGIIDIIIAVLFIAIPWLFKIIGNRLEKAGKPDKAGKFKKVAENIEGFSGRDEADSEELEKDSAEELNWGEIWEEVPQQHVVSEEVVHQTSFTNRPEHIKLTNRKPVMSVEDESKAKRDKIDPEKLVIYSEIMKQKF